VYRQAVLVAKYNSLVGVCNAAHKEKNAAIGVLGFAETGDEALVIRLRKRDSSVTCELKITTALRHGVWIR
jgi:hypothetical protein